jgi:membrane-associated protease RseP (regulator of RpoE activity)
MDGKTSTQELKTLLLTLVTSFTVVNQKNEEIFRGEMTPLYPDVPKTLKSAICSIGGACYVEKVEGKNFLIATFPLKARERGEWKLNLFLFLATVVSTLVVGAFLEGANLQADIWSILVGLPFSITIIGILGLHELGHYFAARRYGLNVSLPYFIPFPTLLGTLGAFIKMRSAIHSRKMLLEIGAAGPLAGLLASIPAVVYGLSKSTIQEIPPGGVEGISLGSSILFSILERLVVEIPPEGHELFLHPIAFAGWAGFFVTALNLLPIGQLDGGHICYAIFGPIQKRISRIFFVALIPLGFFWPGWLLWIVLILLLIKIPHPPVLFEDIPLGRWRRVVGWITIAAFFLTFIPAPVEM